MDYGHINQTLLDNDIDYESHRVGTYHAPFLLPNLSTDPNHGFELDSTIVLGGELDPGVVSPYRLPPKNINVPTKSIRPQPRTNKTRPQTTQDQIKRKSVLHKEEENSFIQSLRSQNVPWKEISRLFFQRFGKVLSNASLQMRMLRRRKRAGAWRDSDVSVLLLIISHSLALTLGLQIKLLHEAYDYWERKKFALIATKVKGFVFSVSLSRYKRSR